MVVSNNFYFHPNLVKIPILNNIFQMGLKPPTSKIRPCFKPSLARFAKHVHPKKYIVVILKYHHLARCSEQMLFNQTLLLGNHGENLSFLQKNPYGNIWGRVAVANMTGGTGAFRYLEGRESGRGARVSGW